MSYNDFYCCNATFWVNRSKRKYKDVERELAKARAKNQCSFTAKNYLLLKVIWNLYIRNSFRHFFLFYCQDFKISIIFTTWSATKMYLLLLKVIWNPILYVWIIFNHFFLFYCQDFKVSINVISWSTTQSDMLCDDCSRHSHWHHFTCNRWSHWCHQWSQIPMVSFSSFKH